MNNSNVYLKLCTTGETMIPNFTKDIVLQAMERKLRGKNDLTSSRGTLVKVVSMNESFDGRFIDLRLERI